MQHRPAPFPVKNFLLFVLLLYAILMVNQWITARFRPPPVERAAERPAVERPDRDELPEEVPAPIEDDSEIAVQPAVRDAPDPIADIPDPPEVPTQQFTLGSIDPNSPYRMLVTLSNRGASLVRLELNSARYRDLRYRVLPEGRVEDRGGYLGHLSVPHSDEDEADIPGAVVQVVGPGTPAERAGIRPGDVVTAIDGIAVKRSNGRDSLEAALASRSPGATVTVTVLRHEKQLSLPVTLMEHPMQVIRPEGDDPLSMLFTFRQLGADRLPRDDQADDRDGEADPDGAAGVPEYVTRELDGLNLREGNWEVLDVADHTQVRFRRVLPRRGVEVVKSYRLAEVPPESQDDPDYKAYHLVVGLEIRNLGDQSVELAYQFDGPTGLPTEGWWYANKIGREGFFGGGMGMRDVIVDRRAMPMRQIGTQIIAEDGFGVPPENEHVRFIGVDAQYFSGVLVPQMSDPQEQWFQRWQPLRVGPRQEIVRLTNTSYRLVSMARELQPGETLEHRFELFAGPKRPRLLAQYGLAELVYYGWFGWIARPMVHLLHFFHNYLVFNYGLAIVMLTIVVRGCMYPLGRKQALSAQKMQEIQPEIKRLQEKYKNDVEGRAKAQQELFRKHNYNPLSGCLPLFIQLPIFMALYRSLMVDVELRQAPLFTTAIRWCSNLAAPDMLFDWSGFMPVWITSGQGIFGLGPFFNLLPIVTVALFVWQQKMFMPPPTDEQSRMQQNMMKYMMLFFGLLFFKVASGLCIYFIASSLWGVAERKLLPHPSKAKAGEAKRPEAAQTLPVFRKSPTNDNGSTARSRRKKKRGRK